MAPGLQLTTQKCVNIRVENRCVERTSSLLVSSLAVTGLSDPTP
jgi:hypothetical protein